MSSDLYNYFMSQGFTPIASAAIVGNAYGESNLDPNAIGDGGAAHGLFQIHSQWHPGYDRSFNGMQQAAFVSNELKTKYSGLTRALNSMSNVADATKAFMTGWERPASLSSLGKRIAAATDVLNGDVAGTVARAGAAVMTGGLSEGVIAGAHALGIGGDSCGWICQFRKWLDESHFWQRLAIGIMAVMILGLAIWMLGNKQNITVSK